MPTKCFSADCSKLVNISSGLKDKKIYLDVIDPENWIANDQIYTTTTPMLHKTTLH